MYICSRACLVRHMQAYMLDCWWTHHECTARARTTGPAGRSLCVVRGTACCAIHDTQKANTPKGSFRSGGHRIIAYGGGRLRRLEAGALGSRATRSSCLAVAAVAIIWADGRIDAPAGKQANGTARHGCRSVNRKELTRIDAR
jgi:hypothetical protein